MRHHGRIRDLTPRLLVSRLREVPRSRFGNNNGEPWVWVTCRAAWATRRHSLNLVSGVASQGPTIENLLPCSFVDQSEKLPKPSLHLYVTSFGTSSGNRSPPFPSGYFTIVRTDSHPTLLSVPWHIAASASSQVPPARHFFFLVDSNITPSAGLLRNQNHRRGRRNTSLTLNGFRKVTP